MDYLLKNTRLSESMYSCYVCVLSLNRFELFKSLKICIERN